MFNKPVSFWLADVAGFAFFGSGFLTCICSASWLLIKTPVLYGERKGTFDLRQKPERRWGKVRVTVHFNVPVGVLRLHFVLSSNPRLLTRIGTTVAPSHPADEISAMAVLLPTRSCAHPETLLWNFCNSIRLMKFGFNFEKVTGKCHLILVVGQWGRTFRMFGK